MVFQLLPSFCQRISSIVCTAHPASTPGLSWALLHGLGIFYPTDVISPWLNQLRLTKDAETKPTSTNQKVSGSGFLMKKADVSNKTGVISHSPGKSVYILFKSTTYLQLSLHV